MRVLARPLPLASLTVAAVVAGVAIWLAATPVEIPTVEFVVAIPPRASAPEPSVAGGADQAAGEPAEAEGISGESPPVGAPAAEPVASEHEVAAAPPPPPPAAQVEPPSQQSPQPADVFARTDMMVPAPHPALIEESPVGLLPVIAPDGRQSWQVYARPFDDRDPRPQIAIVIDDLGLSRPITHRVIQLPGEVTLAFVPYAGELGDWINLARAAGHEVLLQLPMEPGNYPTDDPGPRALLTSLTPKENLHRLKWLLGRFVGYVGVTDYNGGGFAASNGALAPILRAIKDRGLMYFDNHGGGGSVAGKLSAELDLMWVPSNLTLDKVASRVEIGARLGDVERIARRDGYVVAVGRPYPVTIELLRDWLPSLSGKGFAVAPLTAVMARRSAG